MLSSTQDLADTSSSCTEGRSVKVDAKNENAPISFLKMSQSPTLCRFWGRWEFSFFIRCRDLRGFRASSTFADTSLSSMSGDNIWLGRIVMNQKNDVWGREYRVRSDAPSHDNCCCCIAELEWLLQHNTATQFSLTVHCSIGLSENWKSSCAINLLWSQYFFWYTTSIPVMHVNVKRSWKSWQIFA